MIRGGETPHPQVTFGSAGAIGWCAAALQSTVPYLTCCPGAHASNSLVLALLFPPFI
jgi:hypothetical protein